MINFLLTNTPIKFFVQSFWRDEAFTYLISKKSLGEIAAITAKDFSPPLYYFVIHFWMKLFGSSEIVLRSVSLIFFILTVYVAYLFMRDILKIKGTRAELYALFFIITPHIVYYAFEARMYAMFAFLSTLSFYLLFKKNYKWYIFVSLLGLFTHYFMILVVFSQFLYVFVSKIKLPEKKKILSAVFILALAFVPWVVFFVSQHTVSEGFWIKRPPLKALYGLPAALYTGFDFDEEYSVPDYIPPLNNLIILLPIILAIGSYQAFKKKVSREKLIILYLWAIVPGVLSYLVSYYKPLFLSRYLIFSSVGLVLLIAYCFENMNKVLKWILIPLFVIFTLQYSQIDVKKRGKEDFRKVVREIRLSSNKNDLIYVANELNFHPFQYYFGEDRVFVYDKTYDEIPNYVGKVLIPKDKVIETIPTYPIKAFIIKDGLNYEIKSQL